MQLLADGLRKRRHHLLLHLLGHLLLKLLGKLLLDRLAHARHIDGIGDALPESLLHVGRCQVVAHGALHAVRAGILRRIVLHLLLVPREEPLHDLGHRLRQLLGINRRVRTGEVKLHAGEIEVQAGHIERRRIDADGRCVEGGHARQVEVHARQIKAAGKVGRGKPRGQLGLVERERLLNGLPINGEQAGHVEAGSASLLVLFLGERLAGDDVGRRPRALIFHDLRFAGLVDQVPDQGIRVIDAGFQAGYLRAVLELHHTGDLEGLAVFDQVGHEVAVTGLVLPYLVLGIVLVEARGVDQLELDVHQVAVVQGQAVAGNRHLFLVGELAHHGIELGAVAQPHGVEHEVADAAVRGEHDNHLVVAFGPMTGHDVVLVLHLGHVGGQLVEDVGAHHGRHDAVGGRSEPHAGERFVGIDLVRAVGGVGVEDLRRDAVAVFDGADVVLDARGSCVEVGLQAGQVVAADGAEHARDHLRLVHGLVGIGAGAGVGVGGAGTVGVARRTHTAHGHEAGHVEALVLDLQRVFGKRLLLNRGDVVVHAVGQRQDGGDADDADGAGEGRHERAALLRQQVFERKGERGCRGHARGAGLLGRARRVGFGRRVEGARVGADDAVGQRHDARGVLLGQLGIVRDHDDQAVVGDFGEQVHDLHARLAIERARRFVGQQDFRVVDERAGDGHALHLAAGKLAGLLVHVVGKPDAAEGVDGAAAALGPSDAGQGKRQLDVFQDGLMRDEVISLEHEADAVVAVGIPVAVLVALGGDAVDDKVAGVVVIQAADDVEHGRLARAGRAEHRDELVVAEGDRHVVERRLGEIGGGVGLANVVKLEHAGPFKRFVPVDFGTRAGETLRLERNR